MENFSISKWPSLQPLFMRYHFMSLDSTNLWAKRAADTLEKDKFYLITTEEQTAGRGRFDRRWLSPPLQNIYASFVFFLPSRRLDVHNISQVLALAAISALEETGLDFKLKWPNDIVVKDRKIAGVLGEVLNSQSELAIISGIGININMEEEELKKISQGATSLFRETQRKWEIEMILEKLAQKFHQSLLVFLSQGFSPFLADFKQSLIVRGDQLFLVENQEVRGDVLSVQNDGSLQVQLANGKIVTVY